MIDREHARKVVERIAAKCHSLGHGRTARPDVAVDDALALFIEQLLRYVDDRRYAGAQEAADEPCVNIDAGHERIIFECNPDGFLERDILSLCSLQGDQNGQAVLGRSVCLAQASRCGLLVSVQSDNFSFYFGQPIADLPVPIWDDSYDGPPNQKLRITLQLHEQSVSPTTGEAWAGLLKHLQELRPVHLLFLRQLRQMNVTIRNEHGESVTDNEFHLRCGHANFATTFGSFGRAAGTLTEERHYFYTRTLTQHALDGSSEGSSSCDSSHEGLPEPEIVLVFPFDPSGIPIVQPQELYSLWPLGKSGFKFAIQSDHVNNAAQICPNLLDMIATAIIDSFKVLSQHPKLCFTWPRFLPLPDEVSNHPWTSLYDRIKVRLEQEAVVRPSQGDQLCLIRHVRLCTSDDMDQDGSLLFGNVASKTYVSSEYGDEDLAALRVYGLQSMDIEETLALVHADLEGPTSKMRSSMTSQEWHSQVARMLLRRLTEGDERHSALARQLELIPLRDGTWCSAASGPVFWPDMQGFTIPSRFKARTVDDVAARNPERRLLFQHLGVQEASICDIRTQILNMNEASCPVTVADFSEELWFLYLTHAHRQIDEDWKHVIVLNHHLKPVRPSEEDVYLFGISKYSPENLFQTTGCDESSGDDVQGFPASFLHPDITACDLEQSKQTQSHPTWRTWLIDFVGIRDHIRLVSRTGDSLSESLAYIAKHKHDVLLDVLEHLWQAEGDVVVSNTELLNQVRQIPVPCLSGFLHPLWETHLPLEDLQRRCLQFMDPHEAFPFIDLGGQPSAEELANKWSFLYTHLGVSRNNDVSFLLDILSYVQLANLSGLSLRRCRDVTRLYCEVEKRCSDATEPDSMRDSCRSYIRDIQGIIIPPAFDAPSRWIDPKHCLCGVPWYMTTKLPLEFIYGHALQLQTAELETLSSFFRKTVGVPCVGVQDLVVELSTLRDGGCVDLGRVARIYECLNGLTTTHKTRLELSRFIQNEALILVSTNGQPKWLTLSQCLWSSPIEIPGKATVNVHYAPLQDFFVNTLGVDTLTMEMVHALLLEMGRHNPPVSDIKNGLWLLGSFLARGQAPPSPMPILRTKVFPVRYPDGNMALVSAETDFSIVDRSGLAEQFADHVRLLDFTLEEVPLLKPLLGWLGFDQRCLSARVTETTFLSEDTELPISSVNRDLKYKAHALIRIAAAFASPRYKQNPLRLYDTLQATQVVETGGISSVLSITQDGRVAASQVVKGEVHLEEKKAGLVVYVPRDRRAQDVCFAAVLPRRLSRWLMQDPATQWGPGVDERLVTVLGAVLNAEIPVVDRVLAHEGIGQVNVPTQGQGAQLRTLVQGAKGEQWAMPPTPQSTDSESPRPFFGVTRSSE